MDGQDRKLQLTKVKTGNAGLSCYMTSKIDIVILLTKTKNHECFLHDLFNKHRESRILYIVLHTLLHTSYKYLMKR